MLRSALSRNGKLLSLERFRCPKLINKTRRYTTAANEPSGRAKPRVWPFYFFCGSLLGGGLYLLGRTEDPELTKSSYPKRVWSKLSGFFISFEEPAFEKLLPDAVTDPQNPRPYTLVIDLDKFLREQGRWRIAKRPGADIFLFYAAQLYEVVVFSALPQHEGDAIVKKLDPYGCISYSLYRFATKHKRGTYLKDISHLNRDLSKVLVLGHDEAGFSPHPENVIRMSPWKGDTTDELLEDSIDFLEMLAFSRLPDVRPLVQQYAGRPFPEAFDKAQETTFNASRANKARSLQTRLSNFLSLGRNPSSSSTTSSAVDSYEARKQERRELRRKEYARVKELMQQQLQAELQKEKDYYAEHKMSLWDLFAKGPPPPPPPASVSS